MAEGNVPRVYADFHNADAQGRLRLNSTGSVEDLARQSVHLHAGLVLDLYSDDGGTADALTVRGRLEYSQEEQVWVAAIDWSAIRHDGGSSASKPRKAAS